MDHNECWTIVTLRFFGENFDPRIISHRLCLIPTETFMKGDYIQQNPKYSRHRTSGWLWKIPCSEFENVMVQIQLLLEALKDKEELVLGLLEQGVQGDIFIGLGSEYSMNRNISIPNKILQKICSFGLDLNFDMY